MKKYLQTFAFASIFFFHACFILLMISSYSTKTILPSSKKEPVQEKEAFPYKDQKSPSEISFSSK